MELWSSSPSVQAPPCSPIESISGTGPCYLYPEGALTSSSQGAWLGLLPKRTGTGILDFLPWEFSLRQRSSLAWPDAGIISFANKSVGGRSSREGVVRLGNRSWLRVTLLFLH